MGELWVHFGCTLGAFLPHLGRRLCTLWGVALRTPFVRTLGALWAPFVHTLGALWVHFGCTLGALRMHFARPSCALWVHVGCSLGGVCAHFGLFFGACWAPSCIWGELLGALWGVLRGILGTLRAHSGCTLSAMWEHFDPDGGASAPAVSCRFEPACPTWCALCTMAMFYRQRFFRFKPPDPGP